jgi:thioesterase domain-containing protein
VRDLAAAIEGTHGPDGRHVAPLSVGGTKAPWFYVVAHHEYSLGLRAALPNALVDRSTYSLAVLPTGFSWPEVEVRALATVGLDQLLAQQPTGPFLLGGYSVGGAVAWEMACRLTAAGYEVAQLIIIDTRGPHLCSWLGDLAVRIRRLPDRDAVGRVRGCAGIVRASIRWSRESMRRHAPTPTTGTSEVPHEMASAALAAYSPPRFDGPVVVFYTSATALLAGIETLGWERYATRPVAAHWVGGNHYTVLARDRVNAFSLDLRDALDRTGL